MKSYQKSFIEKKHEICNRLYEDEEIINYAFSKEGREYARLEKSTFTPTEGLMKYVICHVMKDFQLKIYEDNYELFKDKISWDEVDRIYQDCFRRMMIEGDGIKVDYDKVANYFNKAILAKL